MKVFHLSDTNAFSPFKREFEQNHPEMVVSLLKVDGKTVLQPEQQGVRVFCIYEGNGEVYLESGYQTQEGDGHPLSELYGRDFMSDELVSSLNRIETNMETFHPKAELPIRAILNRRQGEFYVGDIAGELWKLLEQVPRPYSSDPGTEEAIKTLFRLNREIGISVKFVDSWEPVQPGDQLLLAGNEKLAVRGNFSAFSLENRNLRSFPVSTVRRLKYLLDTAGGCSPGFDPFRRLPLTWLSNDPEKAGDGINFLNNHVVNIPAETSPAHFHPRKPINGGVPQHELYLVLDPTVHHLSTDGRSSSILLFPDLSNLGQFEEYELQPGMLVDIPPGTGHRGLNVFANVLTIPGFKPQNEFYIDRDIYERTGGTAPSNPAHWESKNYTNLDDFF